MKTTLKILAALAVVIIAFYGFLGLLGTRTGSPFLDGATLIAGWCLFGGSLFFAKLILK